ncbi:MAG: peptidylprolyl isomerase [Spirochaetaceae bacterium]|jgi:hypothetical protein|nr:peptidylprolyl isomerase [Spirochaetaceae bacterium]
MPKEEKAFRPKEEKKAAGGQSEIAKKFKQNPLVFIGTVLVLILVIVTFVFWGAGDWILPRSGMLSDDELTFAYYNNIPVELSPGSFFSEQRKYYIDQMRGNERYATERAFNSAVTRTAILDIMKHAGYEPPKPLVDKKVAALPRYQEDGKFSLLRWRSEPQSARIEIQKYMHDDIITSRYYGDLAARDADNGRYSYSVLVSSKEADFIGSMAKIQRSFKLALFPYSSFPEEELLAFVKRNETLFKNVHISQISMSGLNEPAEAQKVLDSIKNGSTTFEDAAKAHSDDSFKQNGGEAGVRLSFELRTLIPNEDDRNAVIALKAGELSAPVKLSSGWGIFRAEAAVTDAAFNEQATLDKIRRYMSENERGVIEDWLIKRAREFSAQAKDDWDAAALSFGVESKQFGPVPLNYGDTTLFARVRDFSSGIPQLSSAGTSEIFWNNAFSTPVNGISEPFVISSGDENVAILQPVEENIENEEAVKNTTNLYKGTFIENEIFNSIEDAIMHSKKFVNNFDEKYNTLFGQQPGQQFGQQFSFQ